MLKIRQGQASDADQLSYIAREATLALNYDSETLNQLQPYLNFSANDFPLYYFGVVEDPMIIGFYMLNFLSKEKTELKSIFVDPRYQHKDYGLALFNHAKIQAKVFGSKQLVMASLPKSEGFFTAMGARHSNENNLETPVAICKTLIIDL